MAVSPILLGPGHILPLKTDLVIEPTFAELIIYQEVRCAEEAGASCPEMLCSPSTTVLQPGSSTRTVVHQADVPLVSSTQPNQVLELPEPGSWPNLEKPGLCRGIGVVSEQDTLGVTEVLVPAWTALYFIGVTDGTLSTCRSAH